MFSLYLNLHHHAGTFGTSSWSTPWNKLPSIGRVSEELLVLVLILLGVRIVAPVVMILLWRMDTTEQLIQRVLREGDVLVQSIQVVWTDGTHERRYEPKSFGVREGGSLVAENLVFLVVIVIDL
jgi:hypothetical protein